MRCKKIVYIAFLLLPFANFPFSKYGLGSDRPLSVILFAVFFLLNVDIIFKKCLYIQELKIYGILFIAYIISFLYAILEYNGDMSGFITQINLLLTFIPVVESIILFLKFGNKSDVENVVRYTIIGYFIMFIIGLLQFLSIYFNFHYLDGIYNYVTGDIRWFLKEGRIQFLLGEPSDFICHFACVILPLKKLLPNKQQKKYNYFILLYGFLGIFTFSITYYIAIFVYFVAKIFDVNKSIKKNILKLFVTIAGGIILILILNSHILRSFGNDFLIRLDSIYHNFINGNTTIESLVGDMSLSTRITLLLVGIMGLVTKPLFGYGFGYGLYAYRQLVEKINPTWKLNMELYYKYMKKTLYIGGFYTNTICTLGVLGLILLWYILSPYLRQDIKFSEKILFLIILVQSDFFGAIPILICWTVTIYYKKFQNSYIKDCKNIEVRNG